MKSISFSLLSLFFAGIINAQTNIKLEEVGRHIGDSVTVCGKVSDLRYFETSKNQPTFLNIGDRFPRQLLTVVIWGTVRSQFKEKIEDLKDKHICITGRIQLYKEKPEIVIGDPAQISVQ